MNSTKQSVGLKELENGRVGEGEGEGRVGESNLFTFNTKEFTWIRDGTIQLKRVYSQHEGF